MPYELSYLNRSKDESTFECLGIRIAPERFHSFDVRWTPLCQSRMASLIIAPSRISNHLNKFLHDHGRRPIEKHPVYSLCQDCILSVNAPDRVQAELMGHKFNRPIYGYGPALGLEIGMARFGFVF